MGPGMHYIFDRFSGKTLVGAEIGTAYGNNAENWIKQGNLFSELVLVDNFSISEGQACLEEVMRKIRVYPFMKLYKMDSCQAAPLFLDEYFDFIYIDSDHSFVATLAELNAWKNKVKKNGFICGHDYGGDIPLGIDYTLDDNRESELSVKKAVSTFALKQNCSILDMGYGSQFVIERNW